MRHDHRLQQKLCLGDVLGDGVVEERLELRGVAQFVVEEGLEFGEAGGEGEAGDLEVDLDCWDGCGFGRVGGWR